MVHLVILQTVSATFDTSYKCQLVGFGKICGILNNRPFNILDRPLEFCGSSHLLVSVARRSDVIKRQFWGAGFDRSSRIAMFLATPSRLGIFVLYRIDARRRILLWLFVHHNAGSLVTASCRGYLWTHIESLLTTTASRRDFLWHLVATFCGISSQRFSPCHLVFVSLQRLCQGILFVASCLLFNNQKEKGCFLFIFALTT